MSAGWRCLAMFLCWSEFVSQIFAKPYRWLVPPHSASSPWKRDTYKDCWNQSSFPSKVYCCTNWSMLEGIETRKTWGPRDMAVGLLEVDNPMTNPKRGTNSSNLLGTRSLRNIRVVGVTNAKTHGTSVCCWFLLLFFENSVSLCQPDWNAVV